MSQCVLCGGGLTRNLGSVIGTAVHSLYCTVCGLAYHCEPKEEESNPVPSEHPENAYAIVAEAAIGLAEVYKNHPNRGDLKFFISMPIVDAYELQKLPVEFWGRPVWDKIMSIGISSCFNGDIRLLGVPVRLLEDGMGKYVTDENAKVTVGIET